MPTRKYFVYILRSGKDHKLYVGFTGSLKKRIGLHNKGKIFATKGRRPLKLVYSEIYTDKNKAIKREKYLKSGSGREFVRCQLQNGGCSSTG